MAAHSTTTHYFSGQGILMLADRDASGNPTGFTTVGNVSDLKIGFEQTKFEHKESMSGNRSTDLTLVQELKVTMSMTMESIDQSNLSLALWGTSSTVSSGTSVAVSLASVSLGKIYDTGYISISNVVVKDSTDTTTYELDKNYKVNLDSGSIYIMTAVEQSAAGATNTIADGDTLHVTLDNAASYQLEGLTSAAPVKWARFEGLNTAESNNPVVVDVFKFKTEPLAELALITDEITQMEVNGNPLSDDTKSTGSKYFRIRSLA